MSATQKNIPGDIIQKMRITLTRYLPARPLFSIRFLISFLLPGISSQLPNRLSEATCPILTRDHKNDAVSFKTIERIDLLQGKRTGENEINVIISKTLLSKAMQQRYLYAPVCNKTRKIQCPAFPDACVTVEKSGPQDLPGKGEIKFRYSG